MARLAAKNLVKSYHKRNVVDDISIHVDTGEIVGLLGPNGAGKTTSFYMVVGLVKLDSGRIFLDQIDITHHPMNLRAKMGIGYLPQEASVFRKLSVADNLRAVLQLRPELTDGQIEVMIDELLHELTIEHLSDNVAMGLSGGERRRVEIARALAMEPQFILLDEPFAGVDPLSVKDIKGIIEHLSKRGIGVLITEHNVRETINFVNCDYLWFVPLNRSVIAG